MWARHLVRTLRGSLAEGRQPVEPYSFTVIEKWRVQDQPFYLTGPQAVRMIRDRMGDGTLTTWFESD
jgi:hypothetical protein